MNSERKLRFENLESKELLAAVFVTSEDDAGQGTLRRAFELANIVPDVDRILFRKNVQKITLNSPIQFLGAQKLIVNGLNAEITQNASLDRFDLMHFKGGGEIQIRNLQLTNGFHAIRVSVPPNVQSDVKSIFANVKVSEAEIGIRIEDNAERFNEDGSRFYGSDFGVYSRVFRSEIFDQRTNGFEVQEFGKGQVDTRFISSKFSGNGNSGIYVRENNEGRMAANVVDSVIEENIQYGAEFQEWNDGDQAILILESIFANNAPDTNHFGAAIEETGEGSTRTRTVRSDFIGNGNSTGSNRGDGRDTGGIRILERQQGMAQLHATDSKFNLHKRGNGIEVHEDDSGQVRVFLDRVQLFHNESGMMIDEDDSGDVIVRANELDIKNFFYYGIRVYENNDGGGDFTFQSVNSSSFRSGDHFDHISVLITNAGDLRFKVTDVEITSGNGSTFGGISFLGEQVTGWFEDTNVSGNSVGISVNQSDSDSELGKVYLTNTLAEDNSIENYAWKNIEPVWR